MAILVCGGAGYIGSHTVVELLENKYEVVVLDNLVKGHKKAIWNGAKFYEGDLNDNNLLDRIFEEEEIEGVIHFAAYSLVGESCQEPYMYYENNLGSTLNLLKKMKEHNIKNIVFSSTAATYGEPERVPILEWDKTEPKNPYGETKLAVEKLIKWAHEAYGLNYTILRYFNVAGAHESGLIGEDHSPETHLIPIILQVASGVREKIFIYGDDYDTHDGTCIRDYIHVTDLANAHILALKKIIDGGSSDIYNLGNGNGFSVREIIEASKKVSNRSIEVEVAGRRAGDPAVLIASSEKAQKELGWKIKYTNIEDIIATAWKWHKNNPNGYGK